jgi:hypothetical protein
MDETDHFRRTDTAAEVEEEEEPELEAMAIATSVVSASDCIEISMANKIAMQMQWLREVAGWEGNTPSTKVVMFPFSDIAEVEEFRIVTILEEDAGKDRDIARGGSSNQDRTYDGYSTHSPQSRVPHA